MSTPAILGGQPKFPSRLPLTRPTLPPFDAVAPELAEVFETGMVTKGKHLAAFEAAIAAHLGVGHAVGVSSCTTGLMLTYRALDLTGDVIVPSFTFMATVHPLVWNGLSPVFADVEPDTWNLDPAAAEAAITPETTAIVATHVFGNPADVEALEGVAKRRGLRLAFDAAHGFGALYQGKPVGRYGDAEVFSASPTKLLVTGEGGVVATNDAALAHRIDVGREYGNPGTYDTEFPGMNARLQEFSALLGLHGLEMLNANADRRNMLVEVYYKGLEGLPGIQKQQIRPGNRCSYKDLTVIIDAKEFGLTRNQLADSLNAEGIDSRKYYSPPVHRHTPYAGIKSGRLPVTQRLAEGCLSLPLFSHMRAAEAELVCEAIRDIHSHAPRIRGL